MDWNKIVNLDFKEALEHINELLQFMDIDKVAIKLNTTHIDIEEFMLENGYIKKNNKNKFEQSMFRNNVVVDIESFTKDEIKILKYIAKKYDKDEMNKSQSIKINIPKSPLKQTTIRLNEKVWNDFDKFTNKTEFNKQDLITMALIEYMNKYN